MNDQIYFLFTMILANNYAKANFLLQDYLYKDEEFIDLTLGSMSIYSKRLLYYVLDHLNTVLGEEGAVDVKKNEEIMKVLEKDSKPKVEDVTSSFNQQKIIDTVKKFFDES